MYGPIILEFFHDNKSYEHLLHILRILKMLQLKAMNGGPFLHESVVYLRTRDIEVVPHIFIQKDG